MAGHSHWAKIKRAKGANDAKRGKIWSKIAKKIMIAAKGGGDPRDNLNLRYVIDEGGGKEATSHLKGAFRPRRLRWLVGICRAPTGRTTGGRTTGQV